MTIRNGGQRLLPYSHAEYPDDVTDQICMDGCWYAGYTSAGLELTNQCCTLPVF